VEQVGPSNIYNFDETGLQIGQAKPQKVVTANKYQATNIAGGGLSESISAIEFIAATGEKFPPFLILKGERFLKSWFPPPGTSFQITTNSQNHQMAM
jgi:hypothetical protein